MASLPRIAPFPFLAWLPLPRRARVRTARAGGPHARSWAAAAAAAEPSLPRPEGTWPRPPVVEYVELGAGRRAEVGELVERVRSAPALATIEWDGDRAGGGLAQPPQDAGAQVSLGPVDELDEEDPATYEPRRRKIRDRYIGARFPGVARGAADLDFADPVIKAARLYFEDGEVHLALELLEIAIGENPHEPALRLARLEILFLARDAGGFAAAARAFRNTHPSHEAWTEIERLGRSLAPGEALFGGESGPREHEHYGPWPHLPNWIRAPWDLTAEIAAADFHRAMAQRAAATAPLP